MTRPRATGRRPFPGRLVAAPTIFRSQAEWEIMTRVAADSCSITVYRTWATANIYAIRILVDGVDIGRLRPGQKLRADVAPGSHTVRPAFGGVGGKALSARAAVEVQAGSGEDVNVRLAVGKFGFTELKVEESPPQRPTQTSAAVRAQEEAPRRLPSDVPMGQPLEVACQISDGERFETDIGVPEVRVIDNSGGLST